MAQRDKFKLTANVWECDEDPGGFYPWLENMGSIVRATEYGYYLEDMLDSKLGRAKIAVQSVPSFILQDPDFSDPANATSGPVQQPEQPDPEAAAADEDDNSDTHSAATVTGGNFSLGTHSVRYRDLPEEAEALDEVLYNVMRMNIKGSKSALLNCVTFPCYVQAAMIVLDKHMSISRIQRMMSAFTAMEQLAFAGDVMVFQTQFISLKRELDNCKASTMECQYTGVHLFRLRASPAKT